MNNVIKVSVVSRIYLCKKMHHCIYELPLKIFVFSGSKTDVWNDIFHEIFCHKGKQKL